MLLIPTVVVVSASTAARSSPLKVLTFLPKIISLLTHPIILIPLFLIFAWWMISKRNKGKGK